MRVSECSLLVAKQLRLDQALRKRGAIHADKWLLSPRPAGDNGLRHQFFPGAAFPANQHIDIAFGHAADGVVNQAHGVAAADQLAKRISSASLFPQPAVLDFRGSFLQRDCEQSPLHFLEVHRRDEQCADASLLELIAGSLVVRTGKAQQNQMLVLFPQLRGSTAAFPDRKRTQFPDPE